MKIKNNTMQKQILNALLDKYERSSHYKEGKQMAQKTRRRIILNFYNNGKCDFPLYDIEQSDRRLSVNRAVLDLAAFKLLDYEWMKGEYEHIIAKVWLNVENLSLAYQAMEREPKGDLVGRVSREIAKMQSEVESSWAARYLEDIYAAITRRRSLTSALPADAGERGLLLQAIGALDKLGGAEYMERVFSLRTFGDSKIFERAVKPRLLSILRKYLDNDDDTTDEDILKQIGIVKYPEQFEFCGGVSVEFHSGAVDFAYLPSGGMLFSSDLSSGRIIIAPTVQSIITIENRANYIEYIQKIKREKELVIYHGGQYSPRKRLFFQAIKKAAPPSCPWYHWSDIDYGGFIMLSRLRREIAPRIIPYRMNRGELERYAKLTVPVKAPYIEKLKKLKQRPELSDCYDCLEHMIRERARLEQEAMLMELPALTGQTGLAEIDE